MEFTLSSEQTDIRKLVREFAEREIAPTAALRDELEQFDRTLFNKMGKIGLCGIPFPEEYGGAGSDFLSYAIAIEELARVDASLGVTLSVQTSLGAWPVYKFGSEEQKQAILTAICSGQYLAGYALTEAGSGSDAGSMRTTAVLAEDGRHYLINGSKLFITNGGEADIYIVFASTQPDRGSKGITAFLVEPHFTGFSVGKKEKKMGIRSSPTTALHMENCQVPVQNRLGEEGNGFKIALMALDGGRVGIAAQAVGIAQGAFELALEYAKKRVQFGKPIAQHQAIQFKLADMATKIEAARLLTYQAAWLKDQGLAHGKQAAMAKRFAGDAAMEVATEAVQIFGGYGYMREYPVERFMRDAKITQIYEGTNEIQRMVIGSYLLKE